MNKVGVVLLAMRLSVFVVLLAWTFDKLLNPGHGSVIIDKFFGISGVGNIFVIGLGVLEMVLILLFVSGSFKRLTYGAVLLLHGVSVLVTLPVMVMAPLSNLLFFAGLPMLVVCVALYWLRDQDTLLSLGSSATRNAT